MIPYGGGKFLQALMATEFWETLEQRETLTLNTKGYCETLLLTSWNGF